MSELTDNFQRLISGKTTDAKLLVPLLLWSSGSQKNIETTQSINNKFFYVDNDVLNRKLTLNNKCNHFLKYPKVEKDSDTLDFFYNDVCELYGWTPRELEQNYELLDIEDTKKRVALMFAYDKKQRKLIGF